jgi:outer membrane lipoprotein-sorting protein
MKNKTMKKINLIYLLFISIICFTNCTNSTSTNKMSTQDADLSDIVEAPPKKKINQTPIQKESKKSNSDLQITIGTFLSIENGDYYQLHIKDKNEKEASFYFWQAYEGADQLNIGNWKSVKGKKIKVTWQDSKEKDPNSEKKIAIKKILAIDIL